LAHRLVAAQRDRSGQRRILSALIDAPTPFATLEEWQRYLAELMSLDPSHQVDYEIKRAEEEIARKQGEMSGTPLIDTPSPFDALETWESYLTELRTFSPSDLLPLLIEQAEETIAWKKGRQKTNM
jgi:hypothetical protein